MFKKLIEMYQRKKVEKIINEPRFTIDNLFVADIVLLKKKSHSNGKTHCSYKDVKPSVIVENNGFVNYTHIKSKQELKDMFWASVNDYALTNIKKFSEKFAIYMRRKNLTPNDLLSIKQVLQLEDALQTGLIDDLTAHDLFK